jgi:hypothetical protein
LKRAFPDCAGEGKRAAAIIDALRDAWEFAEPLACDHIEHLREIGADELAGALEAKLQMHARAIEEAVG